MASRAVVVTDLQGDPQNWKIVKKEKPRASPGHVVVHVTLRPVNPTDVVSPKVFLGYLQGTDVVIGSEGVGYIEEVGKGVTKLKVGQRVVPSFLSLLFEKGNGSWQDYVEVSEDELYLLPDSIPDESAAQFIINPWTVYGLLKDQAIPKGEYLLQNAAGSVLGRQVIQLAKYWGIKTINIVRHDEVGEDLKNLGADEVINSTKEDIVARVKELTGGKGASGALDCVAGHQTKTIAASVRDRGKVFVYGMLGSPECESTVSIFDLGRVEFKWWNILDLLRIPQHKKEVLDAVAKFSPQHKKEVANAVAKLLEDKVIVPLAGKTFKFEDFKVALLEADKAGRRGKVLLAT